MKIVILGFYERDNLGDDLYKQVFGDLYKQVFGELYKQVFESFGTNEIEYLNPDDSDSLPECDLIIVGGGDLLNDYFMLKINKLIGASKTPVYGISLGFPYESAVNDEYLKIFDCILTRTKSDLEKKTIVPLIYIPDLVTQIKPYVFLPKIPSITIQVGLFLARPVFTNDAGYLLVNSILCSTKCCGIKHKYNPRLYSMNTHMQSAGECDMYLNNQIKLRINNLSVDNDFDIFEVFNSIDVAICCRYHSHVVAIMTATPFVSVSPTRKVTELLQSVSLDYLISSPEEAVKKLDWVVDNFKTVKSHLKSVKRKWDKIPTNTIVNNLFVSGYKKANVEDIVTTINCLVNNNETTRFKSKVVSFYCTKRINSAYIWGLENQISTKEYDLKESVKWILHHESDVRRDHILTTLSSNLPKKFKLDHFDTNSMTGIHRSGWDFVVNNLWRIHSESGIILDCFSDQTFGWESDFYSKIGLLPITKPWIGLFHHTANTEYSSNNLVTCFNNRLFKDSLKECKAIIVLCKETHKWVESQLTVPVFSVTHPSSFSCPKFSFDKFSKNKDKKIVQIGAWLRDTYAIYDLPDVEGFQKMALKGKCMDNYFIPVNFCGVESSNISRGITTNKFVDGLQASLQRRQKSVKIVEHLSKDEYDDLLTENIVFIKLIDAGAVNTIIECIIRATPIVVNRLPATEEYLGKSYPLFYETLEEAYKLLSDTIKLKKGSEYLKQMDKERFTIEYFLHEILLLFGKVQN